MTRMSWGSTIGVAFLTGIVGAVSAGYLTYLFIVWYRLRAHDGGDLGYYFVFLPAGFLAGLALGAVISRMTAGFWTAQGLSLAALWGICAVIGFVGRMYGEVAPELDGQELMLQMELKCPRRWQSDSEVKQAEARGCSLRPFGPGRRVGPSMTGYVDWKHAAQVDGQWVVPCEVNLFSSREIRFVDITLGKTQVGLTLQLPAYPTNDNKQWSQWFTDGFGQEVGKPPLTGYAYRCRVKRIGEIQAEAAAAAHAFEEERDQAAKAIPAGAPLARWLPLFEDPDGSPAAYRWGGADRIERRTVAARVLELAPLLASSDRAVMRQAVFALGTLQETPPALVERLLTAGGLTVTLIAEAKAAPDETRIDAERKALQYFGPWRNAMNNASPAAAPRFLPILEEIERDASGSKPGDLEIILRYAREALEKLRAAPASGR